MVRHILAAITLLATAASAQVTVTVKAPQQAEQGQRVSVSYVVSTQDVDDISVGEFRGFDVLFGPSTSRQSSYSLVNGKATSSSTITYTYTLLPTQAGNHKLPACVVKSGGKEYRSREAAIEVLPSAGGAQTQGQQQNATRMRTQSSGEAITASDLYVTATASKHNVYEQEAILLTYKLYTLVSIDQCDAKMPDLDGFLIQELPLPQQKSLKMEHVNGKNYGTVVWKQYLLFPQTTGKLTIPAIPFQAEVVQQNRVMDPFDAFFGGGSSLTRISKTVTAPAVEFTVNALPPKPAGFSGAVGTDFRISGTLTPQQVDANDAMQLRLVLSGTGNLKLVNAPQVDWPKDFETYDPKVTDKTKTGTEGTTGNIVYDYTAVPRHGGRYNVPPVEFIYFDTRAKAYKTICTDSFSLAVAKTTTRTVRADNRQEELKVLADDIRYIRTGARDIDADRTTFYGSVWHIVLYPCLALAFVAAIVAMRRAGRRSDEMSSRRRRAGKAAAKRLRKAGSLMKSGADGEFYDELTRAMWGYVGDKLSLSAASLTKDNVGEQLAKRGVGESEAGKFLRVLEDCEFARFAPGDPAATKGKLYAEATDIINTLDSKL